jgi:hypothetical protein
MVVYSEQLSDILPKTGSKNNNNWETLIHSFIPLPRAERNDLLPFSGASSIHLCYILLTATLLHQLFFHPPSLHLAIYFLVLLISIGKPCPYNFRRNHNGAAIKSQSASILQKKLKKNK